MSAMVSAVAANPPQDGSHKTNLSRLVATLSPKDLCVVPDGC